MRIESDNNISLTNCIVWDAVCRATGDFFERMTACVARFFWNIYSCFHTPSIPREITHQPSAAGAPPVQIDQPEQQNPIEVWNAQMQAPLFPSQGIIPQAIDLTTLNSNPVQRRCVPLGLPTVPVIGHYRAGPGGYDICPMRLLVKLPKSQLEHFPEPIRARFQNHAPGNLDIYFIVYSDAQLIQSLDLSKRNLIFHCCAYPNIREHESTNQAFPMGIFDPHGLVPGPQQGAIATNMFTPQNMHLHSEGGPMAISPDNARFYVDRTIDRSSFFAASELPNGRAVALFGVIVHRPAVGHEVLINEYDALAQFKGAMQDGFLNDPGLTEKILKLLTLEGAI